MINGVFLFLFMSFAEIISLIFCIFSDVSSYCVKSMFFFKNELRHS